MNRERITLSSTHIDLHGMRMSKEALEDAAKIVNSDRNPRIGLEHDMSFPPLGRITDAEVLKGEDGEYYLVGYREYFDERKQTTLKDGSLLYIEYFKNGGKPFTEAKPDIVDKIQINADPSNFENREEMEALVEDIEKASGIEFSKQHLLRKSHIPDPEMVIKITGILAAGIGIIASKVTEKTGEAIGDDVAKFYKLVRASVIGMVQRAIPKLRPITFIFEIHEENVIVELLIKSNNPDFVVGAFAENKVKTIKQKVETSKDIFGAEKIQFMFSEKDEWELTYMLTDKGETIGTKKSFDRRDVAFQELVNKMIERNNNSENGSS